MILTDSSTLLYVEPTGAPTFNRSIAQKFAWFKKLLETQVAAKKVGVGQLRSFELGTFYMGHHTCSCGADSTSYDILLPNLTVTNSLAFHYVAWHTDEMPASEWLKLEELKRFMTFTISNETPDTQEEIQLLRAQVVRLDVAVSKIARDVLAIRANEYQGRDPLA